MRAQFGFTIVDTPRAITSSVVAAFEEADRILVVTDLSVPSVRAAHRVFELLGRLEISLDSVEYLITQLMPGPVDLKKVAQVMGKEPFATLPRDDAAAAAMNDGVPLNGRPARLTLAIDELARRLAGLDRTSRGRGGLFQRMFPKGARP